MNFGSVRSDRVKLFFFFSWGGGLIFETNCIFEYKPSPHFRLDVVYKMGGRINGTLRYIHFNFLAQTDAYHCVELYDHSFTFNLSWLIKLFTALPLPRGGRT